MKHLHLFQALCLDQKVDPHKTSSRKVSGLSYLGGSRNSPHVSAVESRVCGRRKLLELDPKMAGGVGLGVQALGTFPPVC